MIRRRGSILLAAIVLALSLPALADDFKIPPTPDRRVTDNAGALSSSTHSALADELAAYEKATGHQVIVWIGDTTGDVPLETWTTETADHWKIGRRGHDDGAVLFLFMKDHKVRIEVGYGLEGSLTDADAHRIVADVIVPRMKAGDTDDAVSSGVAAMLKTITPAYAGVTPPPQEASQAVSSGVGIFLFAVIGLFFAFLIFMVVMQVVGAVRYGFLVMREGPKAAKADMRRWWFWGSSGFVGGSSSFGDSGGGGFDSDSFSGGGGSFGGGGASGSW
ncbi:MAG: TPM domain-containing protein [Candidatus Baltobacteraceae bacterium]